MEPTVVRQRRGLEPWTDQKYIKIGAYRLSTDFNRFWELQMSNNAVVFSTHLEERFFSKAYPDFAGSRLAAWKRFNLKRVAFIDPDMIKETQSE